MPPYCPNCGTQNPDPVATCEKCGLRVPSVRPPAPAEHAWYNLEPAVVVHDNEPNTDPTLRSSQAMTAETLRTWLQREPVVIDLVGWEFVELQTDPWCVEFRNAAQQVTVARVWGQPLAVPAVHVTRVSSRAVLVRSTQELLNTHQRSADGQLTDTLALLGNSYLVTLEFTGLEARDVDALCATRIIHQRGAWGPYART